jgi:hypothetical protein
MNSELLEVLSAQVKRNHTRYISPLQCSQCHRRSREITLIICYLYNIHNIIRGLGIVE